MSLNEPFVSSRISVEGGEEEKRYAKDYTDKSDEYDIIRHNYIPNKNIKMHHDNYLEFLKNQTELNVKIIDISNRDFVKSREDYLFILDAICSHDPKASAI